MLKSLLDFFLLLSSEQRKKFYLVQILVFLSSLSELVGIASIVPFMTIVSDVSIIHDNKFLQELYILSGLSNELDFVIMIGIMVLILLIASSAISIFTSWRLSMFATKVGAEIADRLFEYYLNRNWLFHSTQNSSEFTKKVVIETRRVTNGILNPVMSMNARIVLSSMMIIGLTIYEPYIAFVGFITFFIAYLILFYVVRERLHRNGKVMSNVNGKRFILLNEGFGGIKDILLYNRSKKFTDDFKKTGIKLAYSEGNTLTLGLMPRYIIELLAFAMIISLTLYLLMTNSGSINSVLPLLSLYAVSSIKILPAFQQIYLGFANLKSNMPAFESIKNDLKNSRYKKNIASFQKDDIFLRNKIILDNISFTYPNKNDPAISNLSLSIKANSIVGIVGHSGSGKSTLIDLLLGLIEPDAGKMLIDDNVLSADNMLSWQNKIGFVPQTIFLSEGSIAENIAFGVPECDIDFDQINRCLDLAQLNDFVSSLDDGIYSKVGERGVNLSGGQRQRIGIARALYQNANILIFDEATSSLDGLTEKNIMNAIEKLIGKKTIIIVAHRLNTIINCDKIFLIDRGCLVDSGSYSDLVKKNHMFSEMSKNA